MAVNKENDMNIANKVVLITGANRGIGRALVNEALKRSARRVYAGTRTTLQHADKRVTTLTLDVTNASQIQRAAAEVDNLDVLINNAGIAIYDDLSNSDDRATPGRQSPRNGSRDARFPAASETLQRGHRQQLVPGGARAPAGRTRLLHFEGGRVQHDAVATGSWRVKGWPYMPSS
jgi:NAD(P)-dependent dehydrogenase (short-subunit alcohol dehydrogenase family)